MNNCIDLDKVFKFLRKEAKTKCTCGNASFLAEIFHEAGCPYIPISEKAFNEYYAGTFKYVEEPKKEISHASEKVTSIESEEPASEESTGLAADDFKLTPG